MSILDRALLSDLFGTSAGETQATRPEAPIGSQPIKKKKQYDFSSYRPEVLKQELYAFLDKLKKSGATYSVNEDRRVRISCKDFVLQEQLMIEVLNNPELEALLILKAAKNDSNLKCCIEERACIRWGEKLSDSLFLAVLCNITKIAETPNNEQPRTDWDKELEQLDVIG